MSKYPNSGILSRNKYKETETQPEFTGVAEVDGVDYWMNAWVNEGPKGKFFKISFKEKQASESKAAEIKQQNKLEVDETIPF